MDAWRGAHPRSCTETRRRAAHAAVLALRVCVQAPRARTRSNSRLIPQPWSGWVHSRAKRGPLSSLLLRLVFFVGMAQLRGASDAGAASDGDPASRPSAPAACSGTASVAFGLWSTPFEPLYQQWRCSCFGALSHGTTQVGPTWVVVHDGRWLLLF